MYPQLNSQERQQRLYGATASALCKGAVLRITVDGTRAKKSHLIHSYLYKCRRLGSSSVLRKYLKNIQILRLCSTRYSHLCVTHENVLHEVLFMVVSQDSSDIPVSRGQRLKHV